MISPKKLRSLARRQLWWLRELKHERERWSYRLDALRKQRKPRKDDRPNVVLLSVDSMGARHVGCYGYERQTTPTIDEIASKGVLFENAVAQANWTKPSLASILTSLYPSVHLTDSRGEAGDRIDVSELQTANILSGRFRTAADEFREAGYATAGFSDGGYAHSFFGFGRGFDLYDDAAGGVKSCFYRLLRWILRQDGRPFFSFIHCWDAHFPYLDRPPYNRLFIRQRAPLVLDQATRNEINGGHRVLRADEIEFLKGLFDGSLRYVDTQIGIFLRELESLGLLDNTILAITADHGEAFLEHGSVEHTECLYDEVLRVPLILSGPRLPQGRRIPSQIRSLDFLPTLMALCDVQPRAEIQGQPLLPWIDGERTDPIVAVTETERCGGARALSDGRFKIIHRKDPPRVEVYDLDTDPHERVDLSTSHRELRQRLETMMTAWETETLACRGRYWGDDSPAGAEQLDPDLIRRLEDLGYLG